MIAVPVTIAAAIALGAFTVWRNIRNGHRWYD